MTKVIPIGTLVRVKDSALKCREHGDTNRSYVRDWGYLYFIEAYVPADDEHFESYHCRSLATGESDVIWLVGEIEHVEGG